MPKKIHDSIYCLYRGALIFLTIIFFSIRAYGGDFTRFNRGDFLQKSVISKDRVVIQDKNFKTKGYLQPSVIDSRKTIIYGTDGKPQGYFQKDVLDNRKVRFNQTGKSKQGGPSTIDYDKSYLQPSVIDSRKTILYDSDGNSKRYFRKDVIDSRKFRFHEKK